MLDPFTKTIHSFQSSFTFHKMYDEDMASTYKACACEHSTKHYFKHSSRHWRMLLCSKCSGRRKKTAYVNTTCSLKAMAHEGALGLGKFLHIILEAMTCCWWAIDIAPRASKRLWEKLVGRASASTIKWTLQGVIYYRAIHSQPSVFESMTCLWFELVSLFNELSGSEAPVNYSPLAGVRRPRLNWDQFLEQQNFNFGAEEPCFEIVSGI